VATAAVANRWVRGLYYRMAAMEADQTDQAMEQSVSASPC
jgi:hypothetical protein